MNAVAKRLRRSLSFHPARPRRAKTRPFPQASRRAHGEMNKARHVCARRRDGQFLIADVFRSIEEYMNGPS
jgi:hypothetical protein